MQTRNMGSVPTGVTLIVGCQTGHLQSWTSLVEHLVSPPFESTRLGPWPRSRCQKRSIDVILEKAKSRYFFHQYEI